MKRCYDAKVIKKYIDQFKEKHIRMKKQDINHINQKQDYLDGLLNG
jgi:hypothetical protein